MTRMDDQGRLEPPLAADEATTLVGFLDYQRATLEWKCAGLDADDLRATVAASSMTLGGILKHLTFVEDHWFARFLSGHEYPAPWDTVDWSADQNWDWHSAADDSPEQLRSLWSGAVTRSRSLVSEFLDPPERDARRSAGPAQEAEEEEDAAAGGLDALARHSWPNGETPSLRWILVHMIEEYARHNGHADLLRESVDGATGE